MVTHEAHAAAIADRVLFLADGLIVQELRARRSRRDARGARTTHGRVIKFALKGLLGRKLRTALTAIAIVLGVAMVSGTYVLTDSIDERVRRDLHRVLQGTDAVDHRQSAFDLYRRQRQRRADARRVAARAGRARCPRSQHAVGGVAGERTT